MVHQGRKSLKEVPDSRLNQYRRDSQISTPKVFSGKARNRGGKTAGTVYPPINHGQSRLKPLPQSGDICL
jgi:hypothetical protein